MGYWKEIKEKKKAMSCASKSHLSCLHSGSEREERTVVTKGVTGPQDHCSASKKGDTKPASLG